MLTFLCGLSGTKTISSVSITSLDIMFGDNITFQASDCVQSNVNSIYTSVWNLNEDFYYQTRHIDFMGYSFFKIIARNVKGDEIGTIKVDLFTCATSTVDHDLVMVDSLNQMVGKIQFSLEIAQEEDVVIEIPSFHVSLNKPARIFLSYGVSGGIVKTTMLSNESTDHEFCNNPNIGIHATLKELLESRIKCQMWIVQGKENVLADEWILTKQFIPYHEIAFQHSSKFGNQFTASIHGSIRFSHVPIFGQLVGGVRTTTNGIIGAALLCPGVLVPEMNPNLPKPKPSYSDTRLGQDTSKFCVFDSRSTNSDVVVENTGVETTKSGHSHVFSVQTTIPLLSLTHKYFEIVIKELASNGKISIGLAPQGFPHHLSTGKDQYSYGFRSDGVKIHSGQSCLYGSTFKQGDVIGCGMEIITGSLYFTRNGKFLGFAFSPVMNAEILFCTVTLTSKCKIEANFEKFQYRPENSKLNGWSLNYDQDNQFYFTNLVSNQVSYVDPRFQRSGKFYNVDSLSNVMTCTKFGEIKKFNPIRSKRVLRALSVVPRKRFLPDGTKENEGANTIQSNVDTFSFHLPSIRLLARFLDELKIQETDDVLTIGSGIGYITACISKLVGSGHAIGFHHSKIMLDFSKTKIAAWARESGNNFDNIKLKQRFPFSSMNEKIDTVEYHENFNKILCLHTIESEHLRNFELLLCEQGGEVIACMDGIVSLFSFDGKNWSEKRLASVKFPDIYNQLSDIEMEFEYCKKLKKYLKGLGYTKNLDQIIHDFVDEDMEKMVNFCLLYHQVVMVNNVSYDTVYDAFSTIHNTEKCFSFLTNFESVCKQHQISYQKAKDLYVKMKFDHTKLHQYLGQNK
jgi:SAM-dependent methyltransferase